MFNMEREEMFYFVYVMPYQYFVRRLPEEARKKWETNFPIGLNEGKDYHHEVGEEMYLKMMELGEKLGLDKRTLLVLLFKLYTAPF